MAVTTAVVTENVSMSRCWKTGLVAYGVRIQTLPRFMYLLPLTPDGSLVCLVCPESVQHPVPMSKSRNYQTVHKKSRISNQQKVEFVNGNFGIQSF
jgi:hypothetical protein